VPFYAGSCSMTRVVSDDAPKHGRQKLITREVVAPWRVASRRALRHLKKICRRQSASASACAGRHHVHCPSSAPSRECPAAAFGRRHGAVCDALSSADSFRVRPAILGPRATISRFRSRCPRSTRAPVRRASQAWGASSVRARRLRSRRDRGRGVPPTTGRRHRGSAGSRVKRKPRGLQTRV